MTTSPRRPTPDSRATRRARRPAQRSATFLERNRNRLLWAGGSIVVLIVAGMAFLNASAPAYACSNLFDPTAPPPFSAPTLEPGSTGVPATQPPIGFVQADMGHPHVATGSRVTYANCPPASGKHYNASGLGPIPAKLYGPSEVTIPQGWVHNLEHGGIVLLYSCSDGDGPGCTDAGQVALETLRAKWPNSPICNFPPNDISPIITRFDDMVWPYAAVVWDVVLPLQTLDEAALFRFYAERGERFNVQEKQCPDPTPTPGPTPTAGPTGTVAPTGTAAPSGTAAPAATTAPSPS